jgi:hypothetical protein
MNNSIPFQKVATLPVNGSSFYRVVRQPNP